MEKKYVLSEERRVINSWYGREITLHKIIAVKDFRVNTLQNCTIFVGEESHMAKKIIAKHIRAGESGGWIESEKNLSHEGNAWIDKGAVVFDEAIIRDDAWVGGEKTAIAGKVIVADEAKVFSDDRDKDIKHRTDIFGDIRILGLSKITSSVGGNGIIKNAFINRPTRVTLKVKDSSQTKVKFECSVGDKKIAREYVL